MDTNSRHFAPRSLMWLVSLAACAAMICAPLAAAQAPAASGSAAEAPSPEELDKLVGPFALYPDDLVALIVPASTNPLQIVQADRFLEKRKKDPKTPIDDSWDDSVKSLVNYPEVIRQMSADLDWTAALGEAVVADQGAVLDAVQAFRRKAQAAGNLKTDTKQVVEVEKEIIKIVPADPQVVYVPQYNPSSVVVYSAAPVYGYWPAPYPSYYYPYAPGAALATGLIWGAAIGAAWGGGHYGANWSGGNNNITINRGNNNINTGDINRGNAGNRPSQQPNRGGGGTSSWKSDKKPGQVSSGAGRSASTGRVGDTRGGGAGGGAGARPSQGGGGFGQGAGAGGGRPGGASTSGAATRSGGGGGGGSAFGGYGSGNSARADSSRGASSRSSMSGGGGRSSGGASSRGGGGGGRGGGGGGRGGGGRR